MFCGLWVLSPTRHLVEDFIDILLLALGSVAIRFVSRQIVHFRVLSRLSLDVTAIFATGYTL